MGIDNTMTYRVRMDDSDFQAKLTQMRASIDSTFGGMSGGGMGGMSAANMMANMNAFQSPGYGMGGWGGQVSAIPYSPVPMAMTPSMGQISMQQSFGNALTGGLTGSPFLGTPPASMTLADYMAYSQRSVADSFSRGTAVAATAALSTGVGIGAGALGTVMGSAMFGAQFGGPIGMIAGGIVGAAAVSPVGAAVADNYRIQEYLANTSFRYMTGPDKDMLTGRGFTRQARQEIAGFAMDLERNDFRVNMADVENIMVKGTSAGLFEGTRDVDDFKEKFRGLVDKVKRITATLNTTASEGIEVIRAYKDMGITSTGDVIGMAIASDAMGMASGRTGMEMTAIGMQGANIFRGTGLSMKAGFQLNQMNLARAQMAYTSGTINADEFAQAGGAEGMAQTMTANTLAGMQTGVGRLVAMSMFDPKTMSLDIGRVSSNLNVTAKQAAENLRNPVDVLRYQLHQREILNNFNAQFGGTGFDALDVIQDVELMGTARRDAGLTEVEDQVRYAAHARGINDEAVIKTKIQRYKDPHAMEDMLRTSLSRAMSKQSMEDFRDKSVFLNLREAASDVVARFFDPIQKGIVGAANAVGQKAEDFLLSAGKGDIVYGGSDLLSDEVLSGINRYRGSTSIDTTGILSTERFVQGNPDRLARMLEGKIDREAVRKGGQTISIGNQEVQVFSSEDAAKKAAGIDGVITKAVIGGPQNDPSYIVSNREKDRQAAELDAKYFVSSDDLKKARSSLSSSDRSIAVDIDADTSEAYLKSLALSGALGDEAKQVALDTKPKTSIQSRLSKEARAKALALSEGSTSKGSKEFSEKSKGEFQNLDNAVLAKKSMDEKEAEKELRKTIGWVASDKGFIANYKSLWGFGPEGSDEEIRAATEFLKGDVKAGQFALNRLYGDKKSAEIQAELVANKDEILKNINSYGSLVGATREEIRRNVMKSMPNASEAEVSAEVKRQETSGSSGYAATSKTGDKSADMIANFEKMAKIMENLINKVAKDNPGLLSQ